MEEWHLEKRNTASLVEKEGGQIQLNQFSKDTTLNYVWTFGHAKLSLSSPLPYSAGAVVAGVEHLTVKEKWPEGLLKCLAANLEKECE